ncbi:acyltransferase family protein [Dokdonella sp.]|uniref:acyltransferase family protein n=1 Tax=Dokdonella sp. TaxID=2291710 RepID=UPI003C51BFE1
MKPTDHGMHVDITKDAISTPDSPRAGYLPYVDGLRSLAVIAVIVYHLRESWLPGGFAGVDVFFVISGFVVSASVSRWNQGGLRDLLAYFYARRMQRIAPALIVCLLATSVASTLFIPSAWLSSSNDLTGLFAFVGLSNFYLAANDENYFSPSTDFNPFTHTWSLGVEEQFYLLFPLLFFAWTRGGRWRQLSLGLFGLALLASLGDAWQRSQSDPGAAFYLITTRFWQLASGVLLYLCMPESRDLPRPPGARGWMYGTGAALSFALLAWSFWSSKPLEFPYPGGWLPVLATLGLLGFLYRSGPRSPLSRVLCTAAMVHVGKRSYSLYLWHWPVLVLMRWTSGIDTLVLLGVALALTVAFAELSYRYVEMPLRYSSDLRQWPRTRVVAAGLAAIAVSATLSLGMIKGKTSLSLSTVMQNAEDWYPESIKHLPDLPECMVAKSNLRNGLAHARIYSRSGCADTSTSAPDIYALGDSHALAFVTMLTEYTLRTGATVNLYPNDGCSYANLRSGTESQTCADQQQAILEDISTRAKPDDVLFLAALRLNRLGYQDGSPATANALYSLSGAPAEQIRRNAELSVSAQLRPLAEAGMRVVFEAPQPMLPAPAFRCSDPFNSANPVCSNGLSIMRSTLETYRSPVMASLGRLSRQVTGASIWDPFFLLCPELKCTAVLEGRPVFFDGDHISGYANRLLYPSFSEFILQETQHDSSR